MYQFVSGSISTKPGQKVKSAGSNYFKVLRTSLLNDENNNQRSEECIFNTVILERYANDGIDQEFRLFILKSKSIVISHFK